jgi:tetratricopeptide (TPR) repeat protein
VKAAERHKLKHDKYAEGVVTGLQWARLHPAQIALAVAITIAVAAGIIWYFYSREQSNRAADVLLTTLKTRSAQVLTLNKEQRAAAITSVLTNYDSLAADYAGTNIAPVAMLQAGEFLSSVSEPAKAAEYYEKALNGAGALSGLATLARKGLAVSLEQAGKTKDAAAQYSILAGESGQAVEANWDLGRCYELLGEIDKAKSCYQKAVELGAKQKWANLAQARLDLLARQPAASTTAPASAALPAPAPEAPALAPKPETPPPQVPPEK